MDLVAELPRYIDHNGKWEDHDITVLEATRQNLQEGSYRPTDDKLYKIAAFH